VPPRLLLAPAPFQARGVFARAPSPSLAPRLLCEDDQSLPHGGQAVKRDGGRKEGGKGGRERREGEEGGRERHGRCPHGARLLACSPACCAAALALKSRFSRRLNCFVTSLTVVCAGPTPTVPHPPAAPVPPTRAPLPPASSRPAVRLSLTATPPPSPSACGLGQRPCMGAYKMKSRRARRMWCRCRSRGGEVGGRRKQERC